MDHQRIGNERLAALDVLDRLSRARRSLDRLMETHLEGRDLMHSRQKNLFFALVYGVLRWRALLDWHIDHFSKNGLAGIHPRVLDILRMGLFQVLFMDRIPDAAAVNTSVHLARSCGLAWAAGFVNALLRTCVRCRKGAALPAFAEDPARALAVRKSLPLWLSQRWLERYGLSQCLALADAVNCIPRITVRANTLLIRRSELLNAIRSTVGDAGKTVHAPDGITFSPPGGALSQMDAFCHGLFQVQDEAAQLVTLMLAPQPGETVLDACAGLGGKTGHMAQLMKNRGHIVAMDRVRWRLAKLEAEMQRLKVSAVSTRVHDLNRPDASLEAAFDRVLLDAPCSGLGVLQRNPDAKWSVSEDDIPRHHEIQTRLLAGVSRWVRPGGRLVYAVCSMEPEENEAVVARFLRSHPDFGLQTAVADGGPISGDLLSRDGFLKTLPHIHAMDGFFAAAFTRKA